MSAELQVSKTKLASHRVVDRAEKVLGEGEVRLSVEYFAFTANNITYGAAGDRLGYWQFFPVDNETGEDWGIIPVWGFADVSASIVLTCILAIVSMAISPLRLRCLSFP